MKQKQTDAAEDIARGLSYASFEMQRGELNDLLY